LSGSVWTGSAAWPVPVIRTARTIAAKPVRWIAGNRDISAVPNRADGL